MFVVKCNSKGGTHGLRSLNTGNNNDINLLNRLLETREPVSHVLGVVKAKELFCVIESRDPLFYADDIDILACMSIEGNKLQLFDLVGTKICSLQALVDRIPHPIEHVEIYFS